MKNRGRKIQQPVGIPKVILSLTIVLCCVDLILLPSHISVSPIILGIIVIVALYRFKAYSRNPQFKDGVYLSLLFAGIITGLFLYWHIKGPRGCGEFFGNYGSCFNSFEYYAAEVIISLLILLFVGSRIFSNLETVKKTKARQKISYIRVNLAFVLGWFILSSLAIRVPDVVHVLENMQQAQATTLVNIFWLLPIAPSLFYLTYSVDILPYLRQDHKESVAWLRYLTTIVLFPLVMFFMYGWYIWESYIF